MTAPSSEAISTANAAAGALLVDWSRHHGVQNAVVSPGSRNTPIALAFWQSDAVNTEVVLDERSAGFYALGMARASQRPVALVCTSGSALANYFPAVVEAYSSRVPLFLFTADRPAELQGRGAPQTMKQRGFYGTFAEVCCELSAPWNMGDLETWHAALTQCSSTLAGYQGPVQINCALREPLWRLSEVEEAMESREWLSFDAQPPTRTIDAALCEKLDNAQRGCIVCGPDSVRTHEGARAVVDLANKLGWPIFAEATSGVRFGRVDPHIVTTYDTILRGPAFDAAAPDCIVRLGRASTSKPLSQWIARHADSEYICISEGDEFVCPERMPTSTVKGRVEGCSLA